MAPYRRPARGRGAVLGVVGLLLSACSAGPGTVGPAGVDGLEIPTPDPVAADFVERIDNPWLPLQPGNEWVYEVTGAAPAMITVTVTDETREVDGVTTTVVRRVTTDNGGEVLEESSDWFAQDTAGNVWAFGATESWEAGVDGAQAGLAMPATPRVGDGYQEELAEGVAEDQAVVTSLTGTRQLESGTFEELLVTEDTTPLQPGLVQLTYYARGTGLVYQETVSGGTEEVELVSFTQG